MEAFKIIPQKPVHRTEENVAQVPVLPMQKKMVGVTTAIPHEYTSHRIIERFVDVPARGADWTTRAIVGSRAERATRARAES